MAKVLICYYSQTGNTEKMAQIITDVMKEADLSVDLKRVEDTKVDDLLDYDRLYTYQKPGSTLQENSHTDYREDRGRSCTEARSTGQA